MLEEVVVIAGDEPLLPGTQKKKPKPASLTMTEKKRKAATISTTLTDCKNDHHEKKLPSVKFEASNLINNTCHSTRKGEEGTSCWCQAERKFYFSSEIHNGKTQTGKYALCR